MGPAAILNILVRADTKAATASLVSLDGKLAATAAEGDAAGTRLAGAFKKVGKAGVLAGAVVAGASVKMAVDFDKSMRNVNSIAQLNEKQFGDLEKSVLALAGPTAQAPKTLAEGLYDLVSSGFNAKQSLVILKASANAATAGLTDTATSTKAVAAVLNAYRLKAKDAGKVSDILFQTVNRGVITFEELASNIGDVIPYSSSLNIGLDKVGASISTLTKEGLSGATATTYLKNLFVAFIKPSKDLANAMDDLGYKSGSAMLKQLGLQGSMEALSKETGGSKDAMAKLFPNIRALSAALDLTGKNTRSAEEDLKAFGHTGGATEKALSQQRKSISFQWARLKAQMSVLAIEMGQKLLPVLSKVINWISTTDFSPVVDGIKNTAKWLGNAADNAATFVDQFVPVKDAIKTVTGAGTWTVDHPKQFFGAIGDGSKAAGQWIADAGRAVGEFSAGVAHHIGDAAHNFETFFSSLLPVKVILLATKVAAGQAFQTFKIFEPSLRAFGKVLKTAVVAGLKVANSVLQAFLKVVGDLGSVIGDVVGIVSNLLRGKWGSAWKSAKQLVVDVWHTIEDVIKGAWSSIRTVISGNLGVLKTMVTSGFGAIRDTMKAIAGTFGDIFSGAWGKIKSTFRTGANAVLGVVQAIADVINVIPGVPDIHVPTLGGGGSDTPAGDHGGSSGTKKARGGFINMGDLNGDSVPAVLERGEYVLNRKAVAAMGKKNLDKLNFEHAARFQQGGAVKGFSLGGDVLSAGESVINKGAGFFIDKLPKPNLPDWMGDLGVYMIDHVTDYIKGGFKTKEFGKFTDRHSGTLGGSLPGTGASVPGHPELQGGISRIVNAVLAKWPLTITSTTGGGHASGSLHYSGRAADLAGSNMDAAAAWIKANMGSVLTEGIHNPNLSIKYGHEVSPAFWGASTWADHLDHIHLGYARGGQVGDRGRFASSRMRRGATSGGAVASAMAETLLNKGYSAKAAMGAMGNAWREGGPGWHSDSIGTGGGGLFGFTTSPISLADMQAFASRVGQPWTDPATQVQFMDLHMPSSLKAKLNGLNSIHDTTYTFMHDWEKPGVEAFSDRLHGAQEAIPYVQAAMKGGSATTGTSSGPTPKQQAQARKKQRMAELAKRMAAVKKAETTAGKRTALWQTLSYFAKYGIFDKDNRAHFLDGVRGAAGQANPNAVSPRLNTLMEWAADHVDLTGLDDSKFDSLSDAFAKARETGQGVGAKKRKRILSRVKTAGLPTSQQNALKGLDGRILDLAEWINITEQSGSSTAGPGGSDLTRGEINRQVDLNTQLLARLVDKRTLIGDISTSLEKHLGEVGTDITKANPPTSKTHWKLKALLSNRDATRTAMGNMASALEDVEGRTGHGGAIFDTQLKLDELGVTRKSLTSSGGSSLDISGLRSLLEAARYGVFDGMFAKGGRLGAGHWGIAGEAGAEIVRGPATITPMGGGVRVENNVYFDGMDLVVETMIDGKLAKRDRKAALAGRAGA